MSSSEHDGARRSVSTGTDRVDVAIGKLKGRDRVGVAGELLGAASGTAGGAVAAGALASVAGASTFLGSSALGSLVGGVLVTATPMGWLIGCALAGGAVGYGIAKLARSGGKQDEVRQTTVERLRQRKSDVSISNAGPSVLAQAISEAIASGQLSEERAALIERLVEEGRLSQKIALARVNGLFEDSKFKCDN